MMINQISAWLLTSFNLNLRAYFLSSGQICTFGLHFEYEGCLPVRLLRPFLSRFQSEKGLRSGGAIADDHLVQFNCCLCPSQFSSQIYSKKSESFHPRYIQKRVNLLMPDIFRKE